MQRLYDNQDIGCVQAATEIIGDKWSPLLLRALTVHRSLRFSELQDMTIGISPRTLSARLSKLEQHDIVVKKANTSQAPRIEYCLTPKGSDLIPIIQCMAEWGEKYPHE